MPFSGKDDHICSYLTSTPDIFWNICKESNITLKGLSHVSFNRSHFKHCPPTFKKYFLLKGQFINCIWNSQRYTSICFGKCRVYPKNWVRRAAYLERGRFASKACVDFAIHNSFKVKCANNWYVPGCFFLSAPYLERVLHGKIRGVFRCEHCSFQVWVHWCCGLC